MDDRLSKLLDYTFEHVGFDRNGLVVAVFSHSMWGDNERHGGTEDCLYGVTLRHKESVARGGLPNHVVQSNVSLIKKFEAARLEVQKFKKQRGIPTITPPVKSVDLPDGVDHDEAANDSNFSL